MNCGCIVWSVIYLLAQDLSPQFIVYHSFLLLQSPPCCYRGSDVKKTVCFFCRDVLTVVSVSAHMKFAVALSVSQHQHRNADKCKLYAVYMYCTATRQECQLIPRHAYQLNCKENPYQFGTCQFGNMQIHARNGLCSGQTKSMRTTQEPRWRACNCNIIFVSMFNLPVASVYSHNA